MAGHSKFKNIMHRKGRADAARSKLFSKLSREITVAAKTGLPDPAMNPRLRLAVNNAKAESLPKDVIDRAIKKGAGLLGDTVTYHSACSMQHGQKITMAPKMLLKNAGFTVRDPAEGHLCCGSAGTYNIMQPEISEKLKARKVKNLEATKPDVIAAGNIGCMTQIGSGTAVPIVHTIELLDWAYGGERPVKLGA